MDAVWRKCGGSGRSIPAHFPPSAKRDDPRPSLVSAMSDKPSAGDTPKRPPGRPRIAPGLALNSARAAAPSERSRTVLGPPASRSAALARARRLAGCPRLGGARNSRLVPVHRGNRMRAHPALPPRRNLRGDPSRDRLQADAAACVLTPRPWLRPPRPARRQSSRAWKTRPRSQAGRSILPPPRSAYWSPRRESWYRTERPGSRPGSSP